MTESNHGTVQQLEVAVTQVVISDGTTIDLPARGVTLFVGPNNAGKSQCLRDIRDIANRPSHIGKAIKTVDVKKTGTTDDLRAWIEASIPTRRNEAGIEVRQLGEYGETSMMSNLVELDTAWNLPLLQNLGALFIYHADAMSRLTAGNAAPNIDFTRQVAAHPIQKAYRDPTLEADLRSGAVDAFGVPLMIDRYGGTVIPVRVGVAPQCEFVDGVPTLEYLQQASALPQLEEQGDGMRSYLGLLLHVLAGAHQISLIDEPEAFLHPPQARMLGRMLADRAHAQQLLMATHSIDIVQGVLESSAEVSIVRITREGSVNHASSLEPTQVRALWSDSLLRYSNLLDGLFHDAVVLCEGDADCRFYSSVLDSVYAEDGMPRKPQILFSHCGGKARLAAVAQSLTAISIPVVVVADFDLLADEMTLRRTVEALGGDFEPMRANRSRVDAALTSEVRPLSKPAIADALREGLDAIEGSTITKQEAKALRDVLRVESGWDKAKRSGLAAVPQGDAHGACVELMAQLKSVGVLVVPVGELERFVPAVGGHGPKWVAAVHDDNHHEDQANTTAREFVREIAAAAGA